MSEVGVVPTLFLLFELLSLVRPLVLLELRVDPLLLFASLRDLTEALPLLSIYNSRFPDLVLMLSRLEMTRLLRSEISLLLLRVRVEASTTLVGRADERVLRSTLGRYILISFDLVRLLLLRTDPGLSTLLIRFTLTVLPV
ncbi:hypothetical protein D3C80_760640 [compost metagenome]